MSSAAASIPTGNGTTSSARKRKLGSDSEQPPNKTQAMEEEGETPAAGAGGGEGEGGEEQQQQQQQQNVTTTTTTTTAAAAAIAQEGSNGEPDRNKELLERITEVETEKKQIEEGTHPEWTKKSDALQRVRDRRVFAAERFKQMQIENIQGLYEYEVMEAEGSYKASMDDLKSRLLDTMEQRVKRLEEDRERVLKQLERVGQTRVLRSKNVFRAEDQAGEGGQGGVNGVGGVKVAEEAAYGSVSMFLSDAEIKDDLKQISTDLAERAKAYYDSQSDSMVEVSVEDNCLHYNDHVLLKGESIIFTSMLSGEDFFGRIASIRPQEVLVKLSDGTKARIHMSYLRNGRIKLKVKNDVTEV